MSYESALPSGCMVIVSSSMQDAHCYVREELEATIDLGVRGNTRVRKVEHM